MPWGWRTAEPQCHAGCQCALLPKGRGIPRRSRPKRLQGRPQPVPEGQPEQGSHLPGPRGEAAASWWHPRMSPTRCDRERQKGYISRVIGSKRVTAMGGYNLLACILPGLRPRVARPACARDGGEGGGGEHCASSVQTLSQSAMWLTCTPATRAPQPGQSWVCRSRQRPVDHHIGFGGAGRRRGAAACTCKLVPAGGNTQPPATVRGPPWAQQSLTVSPEATSMVVPRATILTNEASPRLTSVLGACRTQYNRARAGGSSWAAVGQQWSAGGRPAPANECGNGDPAATVTEHRVVLARGVERLSPCNQSSQHCSTLHGVLS